MAQTQKVSIVQSHFTIYSSIEKKCIDARNQCRKLGQHEKARAFELLAQWAEEEYQVLCKQA